MITLLLYIIYYIINIITVLFERRDNSIVEFTDIEMSQYWLLYLLRSYTARVSNLLDLLGQRKFVNGRAIFFYQFNVTYVIYEDIR